LEKIKTEKIKIGKFFGKPKKLEKKIWKKEF
jgi:hypothetical protein